MPQPLLKEAAIPGMASKISLSIAGHRLLVYISGGSLFTPVASWGRALGWSVDPRRAIVASLAGLAPEQAWSLGLVFLRQPGFCDVQHRGWPGPSIEGSSFWQGGIYLQPRVWVSGAGQQRVDDPRPLSFSIPCLSIRTSH